MKQIIRRRGKHLGTHYIFDGYSEAVKYLSDELAYLNVNNHDLSRLDCFKHWMDLSVREGDWVTADDTKILQVLRIYRMRQRLGRPLRNYELVNIKTAAIIGYYMHYYSNDVCINRQNLHLTDEILTDNQARHTMKLSKRNFAMKKIWKRTFVYYLVIYLSPVFAYKMMLQSKNIKSGKYYSHFSSLHKGAHELMTDPFVIRELEKYMKVDTFRDRLSNALKVQGIDEKRIVSELSDGLEAVKKGSQTHKQFIELAVNITRYAEDKENIGPDGKVLQKIESADYSINDTMLPPPPKAILGYIGEETKEIVYKSIGDVNPDEGTEPNVVPNDLPSLDQLESELSVDDINDNTLDSTLDDSFGSLADQDVDSDRSLEQEPPFININVKEKESI